MHQHQVRRFQSNCFLSRNPLPVVPLGLETGSFGERVVAEDSTGRASAALTTALSTQFAMAI